MSKSRWKMHARTALAIAVSVVAFATGGTVASASSAGVSGSSAIDVTHGQFDLISPDAQVERSAGALVADEVTAFHGFSTFRSITIQSQGFDLEGRIQGTLRSFNFVSLYQVYNLPSSSGWRLWVASFQRDTSQSVLKETFRDEQLIDVNVDIGFRVSAAALRDVSTLRIGFETLRLVFNGTTKDFTVVNGASGGARDEDNNEIPVDFEPV